MNIEREGEFRDHLAKQVATDDGFGLTGDDYSALDDDGWPGE